MGLKQPSFEKYSLIRNRSSHSPLMMRGPISNATGITAAIAFGTVNVQQSLALQTPATSGSFFTATHQLSIPTVPVFYTSAAGDLFSFIIRGWDQFGDYREEAGVKSVSATESRFDLRCYSAIKEILITPIAFTAADTISVGWTGTTAGTQNRFGLPYKAQINPATPGQNAGPNWGTFAFVQSVGGGTFGLLPVGGMTAISAASGGFLMLSDGSAGGTNPDSSVAKSVISMDIDQTAPNTAPLEFFVGLSSARISDKF